MKKILVLLIIVTLLFLVGCASNQYGKTNTHAPGSETAWKGFDADIWSGLIPLHISGITCEIIKDCLSKNQKHSLANKN